MNDLELIKKAEEYVKSNQTDDCLVNLKIHQAYLEGVVDAQKLDSWHFIEDNDFPKQNENCTVYNGYTVVLAFYNKNDWFDFKGEELKCDVIAWRYLPSVPFRR